MNEIQYVGEHLWVGGLGHFLIVLSFVASILSFISYFVNTKSQDATWRLMARSSFIVHGLSLFTIVGTLFYAMYHKYYEYAYVYQHVSDDLPLKYSLSAFWEGQEGSIMLWMFWHIVLGAFLLKRGGKWESPVMAMILLAEAFLGLMLLGVHIDIGGEITKIGSNPMLLLRDTMQAPIFNNADYLSLISGTGLNPLLQNYWMTIHPPVTFLGYASTVVPFGFAIAGMWSKEYKEWLKPAMPWALFSAGILGTGIIMGSVWAYEALSFGGYWSWDPVENAVLVPWITLIAGIHTHLIARSTGYSIKATFFFYAITFPLVVYSTFLTRSGILGDTSAHAFTEMGLETLLVIFVVIFFGIGLGLLVANNKGIPTKKKEESIYSREFWMFIGALVLLFSALLIGVPTSLPVFNSIVSAFDENYVGRVIQDPIPFYNKYQLWISVFIGFLSGISVYMRFREANWKSWKSKFVRKTGIALILSAILTFVLTFWIELGFWQYYLLAFSAWFAIVTNIDYLITGLKGKLKLASSIIAHFGFGMMIIGVLASGLNKETISTNSFLFRDMFSEDDLSKYVPLIKQKPLFTNGYWITYESDTLIGRTRYFDLNFKKLDDNNEDVVEEFTLHPTSVYSNDFQKQNVFNPDTKHYLHKDIFTCIVSLARTKMDVKEAKTFEDSLKWKEYEVLPGDTLFTEIGNWFLVEDIHFQPNHPEYKKEDNDLGVQVNIQTGNDKREQTAELKTALGLQGSLLYKYPDLNEDLGVRARIADRYMDSVFLADNLVEYTTMKLPANGKLTYNDYEISLLDFNKDPKSSNYKPQEGDIAVGALLRIENEDKTYQAEPIYIIRGVSPMGVKAYVPELGLHIKFTNIDPAKEEFTFDFGVDNRDMNFPIPIEIAEGIPRSDFIILQAQVFPGINLLWLGTSLMMLGLFMAWWIRRREKNAIS